MSEQDMEKPLVGCEWFEASLAAALYEPLSEHEQRALDAHLDSCAACRNTRAELLQVVESIAMEPVDLPVDLLPRLLPQLAQRPVWLPRVFAGVGGLAVGLAAMGVFYLSTPQARTEGEGGAQLSIVAEESPAVSPMTLALAKAQQYRENRDFTNALLTLRDALKQHPNEPMAGEAQLALADLEFGHGQRYAEAYQAYAALKTTYPEVWRSSPESANRFDLLSDTREQNFEPLYALNAARHSSVDPFGQLEKIAARADWCRVSAMAVDAMRELVGGPESARGTERTVALQQVQERCTDPVAAMQVKLVLAESQWKDQDNAVGARALYGEVARAGHPELAQAAREALARLDTSR